MNNDDFVCWAKSQGCREDYRAIQLHWTASSVSYVLKPLQPILPRFEYLESAFKEYELYEPIPNPKTSHDEHDDSFILHAYLKELYDFMDDMVNGDDGFGETVKLLQHLQEQTDAGMSRIDRKAFRDFRTAEDITKRKQVHTLWEAITDEKSHRRLEHGWFCDNTLLLRMLVSLSFRDGVKLITSNAEGRLKSIISDFGWPPQ